MSSRESKYDPLVQQLIAGLKLVVTLDENFNMNGFKSHLYREVQRWEEATGRKMEKSLHQWIDEKLEASNQAAGKVQVYMQMVRPNRSALEVKVYQE